MGELWSGNIDKHHNYIAKTGGKMSLFDALLHYNFQAASKAGVGRATGNIIVAFTCQNAETVWGQNVYVVGNIAELGEWDTDKARILDSKNYPDWENTVPDLPADTHIEWKCLKKDGAGNASALF